MSAKGQEHARKFVNKTAQTPDEVLARAGRLFLEATEELVLPAVKEAGVARDLIIDALTWAEQPHHEEHLRELEDDQKDVEEPLPDLGKADSLLLTTGYVHVVQALADPDIGPRVRKVLRSPDKQHREAIKRQLEELKGEDFKNALLRESAREHKNPQFKRKTRRAKQDLHRMRERLREIGTSGEGREGSWFIGAVWSFTMKRVVSDEVI